MNMTVDEAVNALELLNPYVESGMYSGTDREGMTVEVTTPDGVVRTFGSFASVKKWVQRNRSPITPGPWMTYEGDRPQASGVGLYVESKDWILAEMMFMDVGDDQTQANARLVAAAPDLLDACLRLMDVLDVVLPQVTSVGEDGEPCDLYEIPFIKKNLLTAELAIDRATGEKQ